MHDGKPWAKRHLRRLRGDVRHKAKNRRYLRDIKGYPPPVYIKIKNGGGESYIKELNRSDRAKSREAWYRKCCNRKIRHIRGYIAPYGAYRRHADYWWLIC